MERNTKIDEQNNSSISNVENHKLPKGFDVIDKYQQETEQAVVDNLFDYIGRVFYKTASPYGNLNEVNGKFYNQDDADIQFALSKKRKGSIIKAIILTLLAAGGIFSYCFFVGFDFASLTGKAVEWAKVISFDATFLLYLIYFSGILSAIIAIFAIISIINIFRFSAIAKAHGNKTEISYDHSKDDKYTQYHEGVQKVTNKTVSEYDEGLFYLLNKKMKVTGIWSLIFFTLFGASFALWWYFIGTTFGAVNDNISIWAKSLSMDIVWMRVMIISALSIMGLFFIAGVVYLALFCNWKFRKNSESSRIKRKVNNWNQCYKNFSNNISLSGIKAAVESSVPDLIFDKTTPKYDKNSYCLHDRIYNYGNIPQDAHRLQFKNITSGFYKGAPFNISFSSWEWYREAKIINETNSKNDANTSSRSLKRFEDSICIITVDSFANPKLNFVLKNPDGRNIKLQNEVFNEIFSLAVNDKEKAYQVFTPYVQHTMSRCKTWSPNCKAIRQVIKDGSKIHIIFDGKSDFFEFEKVLNPQLNQMFANARTYADNNQTEQRPMNSVINKKVGFGSLDDTASIIVEYIFNDIDLLISMLEISTCLPIDTKVSKLIDGKKTLFNVLQEKRTDNNQSIN
ncbi:MAG: DUF3137 domain-containing protein [Mycoplasma sp.]